MLFTENQLDGLLDTHGHVIGEILTGKDRYHTVIIYLDATCCSIVYAFYLYTQYRKVLVLTSDDESWFVYAVASHEATYQVADELFNDDAFVPYDFAIHNVNLTLLQNGYFI